MASILVIEDESVLAQSLARALEDRGHDLVVAGSAAEGLRCVDNASPDLVLLDLRLPDASGLDLLPKIMEIDAGLPVILMTAYGTVQDAVEAMRRGARDYLQKPLDLDELRLLVDRVLTQQRRDRELEYHRQKDVAQPAGVIGSAHDLHQIFDQVQRLADAQLEPRDRPTILLTGETGTGKCLMARAIHKMLGGGPFLELNCTAVPAALVESELFGHERGTFTDAKTARTGLFEAADGGAIFLDEIGYIELGLQAKFLKTLEEKRIRRLGSTHDRMVNVHIIAATNRDLQVAVQQGEFREDLLHRLRVLYFELPPLRQRLGDLRELISHFCNEIGQRYGSRKRSLSPEAETLLEQYPWPGNIRELRNVVERAILVDPSDEIGVDAFSGLSVAGAPADSPSTLSLPTTGLNLADVERDLIRQALEQADGNRTHAAELLGLTRDTLRYRIEKFDLS
jgi:DNA-binding NtrC family response regulator